MAKHERSPHPNHDEPAAGPQRAQRAPGKRTRVQQRYGDAIRPPKHKPSDANWDDAADSVDAAISLLKQEKPDRPGAPKYQDAMLALLMATGVLEAKTLSSAERIQQLDRADALLRPALAILPAYHTGTERVVEYRELVRSYHIRLRSSEADERVRDAVIMTNGKVVDNPEKLPAKERASFLHEELPEWIKMTHQGIDLLHLYLKTKPAAVAKQLARVGLTVGKVESTLAQTNELLETGKALLVLTDDELIERLSHEPGIYSTCKDISEVVGAVTTLGKSAIMMTSRLVGVVAKVAGNSELASAAFEAAEAVEKPLGKVVATVELIHGFIEVVGGEGFERIEGSASMASAALTLTGSAAGGAAIELGMQELKAMISLYGATSLSLAQAGLEPAFEELKHMGDLIAKKSDAVVKAGGLLQRESNPERSGALLREQKFLTTGLASTLNSFLEDAVPHWSASRLDIGVHRLLAQAFAPVQHWRGAISSPETAVQAAADVLKQIVWVGFHQAMIERATVLGKDVSDIEAEDRKRAEHKKGGEE